MLTFPKLEAPLSLICEFHRDYEKYNKLSGVIERHFQRDGRLEIYDS
jgi:hypothetical protein